MKDHGIQRGGVLVVDDNSDNLGVATAFLKDAGYEVAVASSGPIALRRVERIEPHVILLDINMPEMDGFEVCRKLKQNIKTYDIPVLFMTAAADINSITTAFKVGAVDYIIKPVRKGELLARVLTQKENYIYKHQMGEEVKIRTKKLEESKEELIRFRSFLYSIIDSMPSILMGVDLEGNITEWNKTAEKTTGINVGDAKGKALVDVYPHKIIEMENITKSIKNKEIHVEQKIPHKSNGSIRYEDVTIYPLVTSNVEGAVIRIDDVTEKVMIEKMMMQTEKIMLVGGLAAGMAHEINNPLTSLMAATELISIDFSSSSNKYLEMDEEIGISFKKIQKFLDKKNTIKKLNTIMISSERITKIISNMLNFSRESESTFEARNICELLNDTIDLARNDFDFRYIEILTEFEENLPLLYCESGEIQQVFLNILNNGAQAMAEQQKMLTADKKSAPKFIIRIYKKEDTIQIEIEDNGPGISEEHCQRIFEAFFTTKEKGVGTGLGLSISYYIVTEVHKGTIIVESSIGEGAKFVIGLPITKL